MNAPAEIRPQFALKDKEVTLQHVNSRMEVHGEEHVLACDLKFSALLPNSALEMFDPALPKSLFMSDPTEPDLLETGRLDTVKFPNLQPFKWKRKIVGAQVKIAHGVGNDIVLELCDVDKFTIEMHNGGSVTIGFRVRCNPDEDQAAKLLGKIQDRVTLTLDPPADGDGEQDDDEDDD